MVEWLPVLKVGGFFSARVSLPDHKGICRNPHGYRFFVEVEIRPPYEGGKPWTLDLSQIKEKLDLVLSSLEDQDLTHLLPYPSMEGIALYLGERLSSILPYLKRVRVSTPTHLSVEMECSS